MGGHFHQPAKSGHHNHHAVSAVMDCLRPSDPQEQLAGCLPMDGATVEAEEGYHPINFISGSHLDPKHLPRELIHFNRLITKIMHDTKQINAFILSNALRDMRALMRLPR